MTVSAHKPTSTRFAAFDLLRGAALVGMFAYHLVWDLGYFRLVSPELPYSFGMMALGHVVAASFLLLVGLSLALALRNGFQLASFTRRLLQIVLAASAITALTAWWAPEGLIFFGILHCIALSSLLTLLFMRMPWWLTLAIALAVMAAPLMVAQPLLDQPAWWWLGLGTRDPPSLDWRPVFPWAGFVLFGFGAMKLWLTIGLPHKLTQWSPRSNSLRAMVWGGRHSLSVYLLHQPVFIVLVFMAAQLMGSPLAQLPSNDDAPFVTSCTRQCSVSGGSQMQCQIVCNCIAGEIRKQPPIWQRLVQNQLSPADQSQIDQVTRQCLRREP